MEITDEFKGWLAGKIWERTQRANRPGRRYADQLQDLAAVKAYERVAKKLGIWEEIDRLSDFDPNL